MNRFINFKWFFIGALAAMFHSFLHWLDKAIPKFLESMGFWN
jgi:hypothetical protein